MLLVGAKVWGPLVRGRGESRCTQLGDNRAVLLAGTRRCQNTIRTFSGFSFDFSSLGSGFSPPSSRFFCPTVRFVHTKKHHIPTGDERTLSFIMATFLISIFFKVDTSRGIWTRLLICLMCWKIVQIGSLGCLFGWFECKASLVLYA